MTFEEKAETTGLLGALVVPGSWPTSQQQQLESDGWAFPAENAPASAVVDAQKERQEKVAAQAIRAAEAKA